MRILPSTSLLYLGCLAKSYCPFLKCRGTKYCELAVMSLLENFPSLLSMKTRFPNSNANTRKPKSCPNNVPCIYRHVVKIMACQSKVIGRTRPKRSLGKAYRKGSLVLVVENRNGNVVVYISESHLAMRKVRKRKADCGRCRENRYVW